MVKGKNTMIPASTVNELLAIGASRSRKKSSGKKVRRPKNKVPAQVFGPVATIDTAPVSIGSSVAGSTPVVVPVADGVRVRGRDFMFNTYANAAANTNWTLVGGCPIIPHALVSSNIKNYAGMYAYYTIHGVAFHYITACSTGVAGDVIFYVGKDRADPVLNSASSNFLSVVLSDHNTVMGPLWKNHSAVYVPTQRLYRTEMFNDEDLTQQGPGEVFCFTRTSSLQVPGYVLMDYDITFSVMQVNVRALTFPVSRMKYNQVGLSVSTFAVTTGVTNAIAQVTGTLLDGTSAGAIPSGATVGDVYKVVMCATPATFTNVTTSNLLQYMVLGSSSAAGTAVTITDGFTCYAVYYVTNALILYPTYAEAMAQIRPYTFGLTGTITYDIPSFISLVGSVGNLVQSNV